MFQTVRVCSSQIRFWLLMHLIHWSTAWDANYLRCYGAALPSNPIDFASLSLSGKINACRQACSAHGSCDVFTMLPVTSQCYLHTYRGPGEYCEYQSDPNFFSGSKLSSTLPQNNHYPYDSSQQTCTCTEISGRRLFNHFLHTSATTSLTACRAFCLTMTNCLAYTYRSGDCWVYDTHETSYQNGHTGYISGVRCDDATCLWSLIPFAGGGQRTTTASPTRPPTRAPTPSPTHVPTRNPTQAPTRRPTLSPTADPTRPPTHRPTSQPSVAPSNRPTRLPTQFPTLNPTSQPTGSPTLEPTLAPSARPTGTPTQSPTEVPTPHPTNSPTDIPTDIPTHAPTDIPTDAPSDSPTGEPSYGPTEFPTHIPTAIPTVEASASGSSASSGSKNITIPLVCAIFVLTSCCVLVSYHRKQHHKKILRTADSSTAAVIPQYANPLFATDGAARQTPSTAARGSDAQPTGVPQITGGLGATTQRAMHTPAVPPTMVKTNVATNKVGSDASTPATIGYWVFNDMTESVPLDGNADSGYARVAADSGNPYSVPYTAEGVSVVGPAYTLPTQERYAYSGPVEASPGDAAGYSVPTAVEQPPSASAYVVATQGSGMDEYLVPTGGSGDDADSTGKGITYAIPSDTSVDRSSSDVDYMLPCVEPDVTATAPSPYATAKNGAAANPPTAASYMIPSDSSQGHVYASFVGGMQSPTLQLDRTNYILSESHTA
eukprot:m.188343 g.188343  ORF g.188343 m.188343 type:complete len:716 (+) comp18527_c0_seq1:303-2450(+)